MPDVPRPLHRLGQLLPAPPAGQVERLELAARLHGSPATWVRSLSDLGLSRLSQRADGLELELAQAVDLQGRAHQFIRIALTPRQIRLEYTLTPQQSPVRRRLEALALLLHVLGACEALGACPSLDTQLALALDQATELVSEDAEHLRLELERIRQQLEETRSALTRTQAAREASDRRALQDAKLLQTQAARIQQLERLPDAQLQDELLEWLRVHDGQIRLREASVHLGLPPARLVEGLDLLCKSGRIQRVD